MNFDSLDHLTFLGPSLEETLAASFDHSQQPLQQQSQSHTLGNGPVKEEEQQPKRPNSAFNIFFQVERQRLISEEKVQGPYTRSEVHSIKLDKAARVEKSKRPHRKTHGRITFVELAKTIAQKWKTLDTSDRRLFEERASDEKRKYAIELEDYLIRQVPTQQVKKRLSALRRGSLGKYIQGRQHKVSSPVSFQQTPNQESPATVSPSDCRAIHSVSPSSTVPSLSRRASTGSIHPDPTSSHYPEDRPVNQLERARNLERLYRMQMQLYDQQMRLQAEIQPQTLPSYAQQQAVHSQLFYDVPSPEGLYHTPEDNLVGSHVVSQAFEADETAYDLPYDPSPVTAFDQHQEEEYHHDPLL